MLFRLTKNRKLNSPSPIYKGKRLSLAKQKETRDTSTHEDVITMSPQYSGLNVVNNSNNGDCPHLCLEHVITQDEENNIRSALKSHFLFKYINEELLHLLLYELVYFTYDKDKIIYEQGDEGNFFYILAQGSVKGISILNPKTNKVKETVYTPWNCFGELSLMNKYKREETLITLSNVVIFALDGESFRDIQKAINETRLKERFAFLNTIPIFQSLDNISKHNIATKIKLKEFKPNEKIITYGTIGDNLYIIKNGLVSCRIGVKEIRKLGNNEYFGQNAILVDMKRSCDVLAISQTICYEISRDDLKDALGVGYVDVILFAFFKNCIDHNEYFRDIFIEFKLAELFKCFSIYRYTYKERLISEGYKSSKRILIIIDGAIYKENTESGYESYAKKGEMIGESILKDPSTDLPSDLLAYPDCISFEANVVDICKILNININIHNTTATAITTANANVNAINASSSKTNVNTHHKTKSPLKLLNTMSKLKKLYLFKNLSEKTLEMISHVMIKHKYHLNDIIVKEGSLGESLFMISSGRVRVNVKGNAIRDLDSGNCFGEIALLESGLKRTATVIAIDDKVVCYEILKSDFDKLIIDNTVKEYMKKKIALQDTSITLTDLYFVRFLGKGKFGNVNLVHNNKNLYAIKQVSRKAVEKQKILARYFVNERRIMLSLDHPFIVKMVKTFKNNYFCFFLMEYVNGKNLDEYLARSNVKKYNIDETRFYIGNILIMLEYLQKKLIAHRDIKPSNIMIDSNGYLKMIDFGTAKVLHDYTNTVIGTPHYISPEILSNSGYSLSCDFWSVGVCMFEMFYGVYPFGQHATEVLQIYKEVLRKDLHFPSNDNKYVNVNTFIKDLLTKKVNQRICNVEVLKKRAFFEKFDWDGLIDFRMVPPYIPNVKGCNLSNYNNEECLFDNMIQEDKTVVTKKEMGEVPQGYNKRWADEF